MIILNIIKINNLIMYNITNSPILYAILSLLSSKEQGHNN